MNTLLASNPATTTPAMKMPGIDVSSVSRSCAGIPVVPSIGTPMSRSRSMFGANPLMIDVRHVREIFTRHADAIGRPEITGGDHDGFGAVPVVRSRRMARLDGEVSRSSCDPHHALVLMHRNSEVAHDRSVVRERIT